MTDLGNILSEMRTMYREIFWESSGAIKERIEELKPLNFEGDIFDKFEENSIGRQWQNAVIEMFDNDISREIFEKWQKILAYRENFQCLGCATCCNLACSEYSHEELQAKAENGDNFAQQFTQIFVPYNTKEDAKKIYPEYIEMLSKNVNGSVYFYHCPKLTSDKRCSDYENRPDICRHFPDNPLDILPKSCGFYQWRQEVLPTAMTLHSMIEIISYYKEKITTFEEK